jgi:hypothetical protein
MSPIACSRKHPHDAHAVLEIIYDCYVNNRKNGMCDTRAKSRALSRNRLEDIARILGEPSPYSIVYSKGDRNVPA